MKKVKLLVCSLLVVCTAFAIDPPKVVKEAFESRYSMASNVTWERGNAGWEANFELNEKKCSAVFDDNGAWIETDTEIPVNFLPPLVASAVKDKFQGATIEAANKIEHASQGSQYSAKINQSGLTKEVVFSEDGTIIKE